MFMKVVFFLRKKHLLNFFQRQIDYLIANFYRKKLLNCKIHKCLNFTLMFSNISIAK